MTAVVRDLPVGIAIPSTTDDLTSALNGLGALVTAKEWERAAIVWAWTRDGRQRSLVNDRKLPVQNFIALGITGLQSKKPIAKYRKAWQWAIDNGHATSVAPGETQVILPDAEWGAWEFVPDVPRPPVDPAPEPPAPTAPVIPMDPNATGRYPCKTCGRHYMKSPDLECATCETERLIEDEFKNGPVTIAPDWDKAVADGDTCTGVFHHGRPDITATIRAVYTLKEKVPTLTPVEQTALREMLAEMSAWLDTIPTGRQQ